MSHVTIRDVAEVAGVGVSTVSRAINNHPDIKKETREKILLAITETGFVPNNAARNLKRTESNTVAVVTKAVENPFFSKLIPLFEKEIRNKSFHYYLRHVDQTKKEIQTALSLVQEKKVKGIIFLGGDFRNSEESLSRLKIPFVVSTMEISSQVEDQLCAYVSVDDVMESYHLVQYLIAQGHEKIAILRSPEEDTTIGLRRFLGYEKAMNEANLPIHPQWIRKMSHTFPHFTMESGHEMMAEFLEENPDVTAIFAISDAVAVGAAKAVLQAGKSIPDDFSIVGFDGISIGEFYNPSITTMKQPFEEIVKASSELLFEMIETGMPVENKVFSAQLEQRESVKKRNY